MVEEMSIKHPDSRFLSDGFCRNILGNPRAMECCGETTEAGHIYCKSHEAKNYDKKRKPRMIKPDVFMLA